MRRSLLALITAALLPATARSQSTTADQFNAWTSFNANVQVTANWWLLHETFWRRSEGFEAPMQFKAGLSLERRTGPWGVSLGYAYWLNHPYGAFPTLHTQPEHRIWQQAVLKHSGGRVRWNHRLRIEERFIERFHASGEQVVSDGFRYLGRARYQVQALVPFFRAQQDGELSLVPLGEAIVRYGDPTVNGNFDQLRLGLLGAWRVNARWQLRAGYLFQYLVRSDNVHIEHNHTLVLAVNLDLPLATTEASPGN